MMYMKAIIRLLSAASEIQLERVFFFLLGFMK